LWRELPMNRAGNRMAVLKYEEIKQIYGLLGFKEGQRNTYFALIPRLSWIISDFDFSRQPSGPERIPPMAAGVGALEEIRLL
jgi:hypothetical protein